MSAQLFPFAVRLLGFGPQEAAAFDAAFAARQGQGFGYVRLEDDNLQDPDLHIAAASHLGALAALAHWRPSELRPALLIGRPAVQLDYPRIDMPVLWPDLFNALDRLIERRADALSRLEASDVVTVTERRRRPRPDIDLTDPADYEKLRGTIPENGAVLVIDRNSASRDYLAELLARQRIPVLWAGDESTAVELCRTIPMAAVLINTSTPGIDPYRLCWGIKEKNSPVRTTVILLLGNASEYDRQQARYVGVEGFLTKPIANHHLVTVLKKYLPDSR